MSPSIDNSDITHVEHQYFHKLELLKFEFNEFFNNIKGTR